MTIWIKVNLCGREIEAAIVDKLKVKKRYKRVRKRVYEWNDALLVMYVPVKYRNKKFLVIPVDDEFLQKCF